MVATIVAFVITLLANIAASVVIFFMMLVAMNGFSGSDAEWGLAAYITLAILFTLLTSAGAALIVHHLLRKQFSTVVAALVGISVFVIVGVGLKVAASIVGLKIAEYVRANY